MIEPDPALSPEQRARVEALTEAEIAAIEEALMSCASEHWQKTARIAGSAMVALEGRVTGIPIGYYVERLRILANSGRLEMFGDLNYMGLSEVRLPATGSPASA